MAWIAPVIGGAAELLGGFLGRSGQQSANRTNIKLQERQQKWEKMMSDTAVFRHVQDLKSAGLNPMLGYSGEASTPNVAPAHVENENHELSAAAGRFVSSAGQAMLMKATIAKTAAEARKADAEAHEAEASVPYHAEAALTRERLLNTSMDVAIIDRIRARQDMIGEEAAWQSDKVLAPLIHKLHEINVAREQAGLPESEAMAEFYRSTYGKKIAPYLKSIGDLQGILGTAVGGALGFMGGRGLGKKLSSKGMDAPWRRGMLRDKNGEIYVPAARRSRR